MKKLIYSLMVCFVAASLTAGEGQCDKSKGPCPAGEKKQCDKGCKGGCCKDKQGKDKPADQGKKS